MEMKLNKSNIELIKELIKIIPDKVEKFENREIALTSNNTAWVSIEVYKEGFYLIFEGTRNKAVQWFTDDDGELIAERKPNKNKLNMIYKTIPTSMYVGVNELMPTMNM
jgi:hypothetical protein